MVDNRLGRFLYYRRLSVTDIARGTPLSSPAFIASLSGRPLRAEPSRAEPSRAERLVYW